MRQRFLILCAPIGKDCDSFAVFVHDGLICLASNNKCARQQRTQKCTAYKNSAQSLMVC